MSIGNSVVLWPAPLLFIVWLWVETCAPLPRDTGKTERHKKETGRRSPAPKAKAENGLEEGEMSPRAAAAASSNSKKSGGVSGKAVVKVQEPKKKEAGDQAAKASSKQPGKRKAEEGKSADVKRRSLDDGSPGDREKAAAKLPAHAIGGAKKPVNAPRMAAEPQRRLAIRSVSEERNVMHEGVALNGRASGPMRAPIYGKQIGTIGMDDVPGPHSM